MEKIMKNMTLEQIASACDGEFFGDESLKKTVISSISTDSRNIEKNSLFVAIVGNRVDGHDFIASVFDKGVICCISERILEQPKGAYIKVDSSLEAIKKIAMFYRRQLDIPVVGVTGSVGKTSTKEMIASVLSQKFCTLKTDGNFNNELGLPLTIFRLRAEHEIAVLEMGISDFDEMHRLSEIAAPNVAVITNIGQCHLENLGNRTGVLKAKTEIFDFLSEDGSVVLNGDDDKLATVQQVHGRPVIYFGINHDAAVYADNIENNGLKGIACTIHFDGNAFRVDIPIPGIHMVYNALAATAVGRVFCLTAEQIKKGIEEFEPVGSRVHIFEKNGKTVIDDCYNANPVSMKAAIDVLKEGKGRKVAILGDMGELGVNEKELHALVGRYCAESGIDLLICAGSLSRSMAAAAALEDSQIEIHSFADETQLMDSLSTLLKDGDTVLVKASRFMGYEQIVNVI